MSADIRTTARPHLFRITVPERLARILVAAGAVDGRKDRAWEVTFTHPGGTLSITEQAPSREAAIAMARTDLLINVYPLGSEDEPEGAAK